MAASSSRTCLTAADARELTMASYSVTEEAKEDLILEGLLQVIEADIQDQAKAGKSSYILVEYSKIDQMCRVSPRVLDYTQQNGGLNKFWVPNSERPSWSTRALMMAVEKHFKDLGYTAFPYGEPYTIRWSSDQDSVRPPRSEEKERYPTRPPLFPREERNDYRW